MKEVPQSACRACKRFSTMQHPFECDYHFWLRLLGQELARPGVNFERVTMDNVRRVLDGYQSCIEPNFYRPKKEQP